MARAIVLAAVVLLAGCGGGDDETAPPPQPISTVAAGSATDIAGKTLYGATLSLGDLRGRPVVVNVWSSW